MPVRSWRTRVERWPRALAVMLLLTAAPLPMSAQTAQLFSLQVSGLGAYPLGGGLEVVTLGLGWEAQVRWNPGAFSVGAGIERTVHEVSGAAGREVVLAGGFLEPRYVVDIGLSRVVAYLSGRAAISQVKVHLGSRERTATGYTLNGGGGVLSRLGERLNLDVGVTVGFKDLGSVFLPIGPTKLGTGANVVGRVGLAVGIW